MDSNQQSEPVAGKTIRFAWNDGPTKGKVHEHVFHDDGTVEWHDAEAAGDWKRGQDAGAERVKFADEPLADGMRLVSYLSKSGYTLTVVLDAKNEKISGIASNDKTWMPVHGTFEIVD